MSDTIVPLILNGLQENTCQEGTFFDAIKAVLNQVRVAIPDNITNVVVGPDQPSDSQRDAIWFRTSSDNVFVGIYSFSDGEWAKVFPYDLTTADGLVPPGAIFDYGGLTAPTGYLLCDGTVVSRSLYPELFAAIGTAYGAGDGSTTFNLPDARGRFSLTQAVSGTGANLGDTGGQLDHTHTGPAHTHASGNLRATIGINLSSGDKLRLSLDGLTTFTSDYVVGDFSSPIAPDSSPNTPTTVVTGATASAGTGPTGTANPAFIVFNKIIKT